MKIDKSIAVRVLIFPIVLLVATYLKLFVRRQHFYITGTGSPIEGGERIFFRSVFHTHSDILPTHSLEEKFKKDMRLSRCIILFWFPIKDKHLKYFNEPYDLEILGEPENFSQKVDK